MRREVPSGHRSGSVSPKGTNVSRRSGGRGDPPERAPAPYKPQEGWEGGGLGPGGVADARILDPDPEGEAGGLLHLDRDA